MARPKKQYHKVSQIHGSDSDSFESERHPTRPPPRSIDDMSRRLKDLGQHLADIPHYCGADLAEAMSSAVQVLEYLVLEASA